jgi:virginiamycin B lyase
MPRLSIPTAGAGLASITAGPDGNMWFTERAPRKIGRVDASGTFAEFPTPAGAPAPQQIFPGPNGTLWAIACNSFGGCIFGPTPFIVTTTAGTTTRLDVNIPSSKAFGASACTPADGDVWHRSRIGPEPVQLDSKVARINPAGAALPSPSSVPRVYRRCPDGNVYTWLSGR